ncbi:MAG: hypothetical protein ACR2QA_05785 [Solirubrobacteraceae bacterium]
MTVMAGIDNHTLWWISLGIGLVVVLVVIVLMSLLLSFIKDIQRGTGVLLETANQVAASTAKIPVLATTASVLEEIKAEALIHYGYLQTQTGRG